MAASFTLYSCAPEYALDGTIDFDTDAIKWALVSSAYTPLVNTHVQWADVSANEVAAAGGYITGGLAATGLDVTRSTVTTTYKLANFDLTATGGDIPTWRYAVLYASKTANGITNPLIGYVLGDTTPANIPLTPEGAVLRIRVNPSGLFTAA